MAKHNGGPMSRSMSHQTPTSRAAMPTADQFDGGLGAGARCSPASAGARATAAWRRRRHQGAVLVTVEVDAADIELLARTRWLSPGEAHDRSTVGDAVARLLGRVFEQLGSRAGRA